MELYEATKNIVKLKYEMMSKINKAVEDFEQTTGLVVVGINTDILKRIELRNWTPEKYLPALEPNDIDIRLLEI